MPAVSLIADASPRRLVTAPYMVVQEDDSVSSPTVGDQLGALRVSAEYMAVANAAIAEVSFRVVQSSVSGMAEVTVARLKAAIV